MGLISPEKQRELRLKLAKDVVLKDTELTVKISKMLASSGFAMSEGGTDGVVARKAHLFLGSCITEKGDPLFKRQSDVEEFMGSITLDDATQLITEISSLAGDKPGN